MNATATAGFHDLGTLLLYLDEQCRKINDLAGEISEVQHEFEGGYYRTQQAFENQREAAMARLEQLGDKGPAWLLQAVQQALPAVQDKKHKRLQDLKTQLAQLEQQRTAIEQQSQTDLEALQTKNPELNAREEELKRVESETQEAIKHAEQELLATGKGLGWLLHAGHIIRLRHDIEKLTIRLYGLNQRLTEVRKTWQTMRQKTTESEHTRQDAWRLRTAEIARFKREQAELESDFDGACGEAATQQVLNGLAEPKTSGDADLDAILQKMVAAHSQDQDYENGIAAVSELMGLIKGVCEGLTRMGESVKSLKGEQDMHADLPQLKLQAPAAVLGFHAIWDDLRPVVLDEKKAAAHPRDFATRLKSTIGDHLSDKALDSMFSSLGNELDRATKEQW